MDVTYFLQQRTDFIRFFYDQAERPFLETRRKIEDQEPPWHDPPCTDSGEPAYLEDWMDAGVAIQLAGVSSVALLADTLKLYFSTIEHRVIRLHRSGEHNKIFKRKGFVAAYRMILGEHLEIDWSDCPADFAIIEQIVLARNSGLHGEHISSIVTDHDRNTLAKHPRPFFASDDELTTARAGDGESLLFRPALEITRSRLFEAIDHVEKLAAYLDGYLFVRAPPP